jgi:hypothetical protein
VREAEPPAVNVIVVFAEFRTRRGSYSVRAVKTQWRRRDDNAADFVVVDPLP